jgi:phosphoglycolate phosphatase
MTATYRLVIFDFDGTLADSFGWLRGILNDVAVRYRFRTVDDAELAMLRGRDNRAIIRHLGVPRWKLPLIARHLRQRAAQAANGIRLFEGADEMLRRLVGGGVMLAVVSSNDEQTVRRILGPETGALISRFACGASIFGKAAKFRRVLRGSGVAPRRVICIGDEVRDIEAARSLGLDAGAVTWAYATAEVLRAHAPTMVFERMEEIARRLAPAAVRAHVA